MVYLLAKFIIFNSDLSLVLLFIVIKIELSGIYLLRFIKVCLLVAVKIIFGASTISLKVFIMTTTTTQIRMTLIVGPLEDIVSFECLVGFQIRLFLPC